MVNMESLPDDLLFGILVRLPAQDIHHWARLVCRRWYLLIRARSFKYAHFEHTTSGLLINFFKRPVFATIQQGRIEVSNFSYNLSDNVWASCNGLILELERNYGIGKDLYIANPITHQRFVLPPFAHGIYRPLPGIAYAAKSMGYKVAIMYSSEHGASKVLRFAILSVGVDNFWRDIHTEHFIPFSHKEQFWEDDPIVTEGFMHWVIKYSHVLTLNVETEVITQTPVPQVSGEYSDEYYLSMGAYLSFLISCSMSSWKVCEMKPETGDQWKWAKMAYIDLEPKVSILERFKWYDTLVPVGWLKHREVLVICSYGPSKACLTYNLHTEEIDWFELDFPSENYDFVVHRNSLLYG